MRMGRIYFRNYTEPNCLRPLFSFVDYGYYPIYISIFLNI